MNEQLCEDLKVCGESVGYWLSQNNKEYTLQSIKDMRELLDRAEKELEGGDSNDCNISY